MERHKNHTYTMVREEAQKIFNNIYIQLCTYCGKEESKGKNCIMVNNEFFCGCNKFFNIKQMQEFISAMERLSILHSYDSIYDIAY